MSYYHDSDNIRIELFQYMKRGRGGDLDNHIKEREEKRSQMIEYGALYGLSDPRTVKASKELDEILNKENVLKTGGDVIVYHR